MYKLLGGREMYSFPFQKEKNIGIVHEKGVTPDFVKHLVYHLPLLERNNESLGLGETQSLLYREGLDHSRATSQGHHLLTTQGKWGKWGGRSSGF